MLCPNCQTVLKDAPDSAGKLAGCRVCGHRFRLPSLPTVLPPTTLTDYQRQPVNILMTDRPREPRIDAGGWFSRSFATTAGIVAALIAVPMLFLIILVVIAILAGIAANSLQEREQPQSPRSTRTENKPPIVFKDLPPR